MGKIICEEEKMEDYEKCKHVQSIGTYAVYVDPGCPKAHKIKGTLVSSRRKCEHCREEGEENEKNTGRNGKIDSGNAAERGKNIKQSRPEPE